MKRTLGRHLVADFHGCTADLNDPGFLMRVLEDACKKANATIVEKTQHHFSPYGVTAVIVIAESHLAVHTWPEYKYAAVDVFTCGDSVRPMCAFEYLKTALGSTRAVVRDIPRGVLDDRGLDVPEPEQGWAQCL